MSPLHLHLDAIGGVAGDMFIAAVTAAFPDLRDPVLDAIRAAGVPADVDVRFVEHRDHALTGLRFVVDDPHERAHRHAHAHGEHHHHDETPFARIRDRLLASTLSGEIKRHAVAIFTSLAEVEGRIHGVAPEQVNFHELGGWDSIADIVGASALIAAMVPATWSVSTLPLGRGRVHTAHGDLPVPSPATAELLQGFELADDGRDGERITPTGAAILKHLGASQASRRGAARLLHSGHGFGTRSFPGLSNVLRILAFEPVQSAGSAERVAWIAFEVDDQTPEDLAIALDHLRAHPAVLDVLQLPAFGKKGRMGVQVQVLARPDEAEEVFAACFSETATLGLRWHVVERRVLDRSQSTVEVEGRKLRLKLTERAGAATAKVESDDLRAVPGGRAARERARRQAEHAGLKEDKS